MGFQNITNRDGLSTYEYTYDFEGAIVQTAVSTSSNIWSFKTNGTIAIAKLAGIANHPGIVQLRSGSNGAICAICLSDEDTTIAPVLPSGFFDITWLCRPVNNDTNTIYRIGMFNPNVAASLGDAIYFDKAGADDFFKGTCLNTSVATSTASFGAYTANTWHKFRLRRIDASTIGFTFDDAAELTVATNVPTVPLVPAAYSGSLAAANKDLDVDWFRIRISGLVRY